MNFLAAGDFSPPRANFFLDARRKVIRTWFVQIFLIDFHFFAPFSPEER
jgi:hypothetical protein